MYVAVLFYFVKEKRNEPFVDKDYSRFARLTYGTMSELPFLGVYDLEIEAPDGIFLTWAFEIISKNIVSISNSLSLSIPEVIEGYIDSINQINKYIIVEYPNDFFQYVDDLINQLTNDFMKVSYNFWISSHNNSIKNIKDYLKILGKSQNVQHYEKYIRDYLSCILFDLTEPVDQYAFLKEISKKKKLIPLLELTSNCALIIKSLVTLDNESNKDALKLAFTIYKEWLNEEHRKIVNKEEPFYLAYLLSQNQHTNEALTLYQELFQKSPTNVTIINNLAVIYYKDLYKYEEALKLLNKGYELNPKDEYILRNLKTVNTLIEEQKALTEKKEYLEEFTNSLEPILETKLTLEDKLYLSVISRANLDENLNEILPLNEVKECLAPTIEMSDKIVFHLVNRNIIKPTVSTLISAASVVDGIVCYDKFNVRYTINVAPADDSWSNMIGRIISLDPDEFIADNDFILATWKEIALEESIEYLYFNFKQVGFTSFTRGEKTNVVFQYLLQHFSTAQIYSIIYSRVNNATRFMQEQKVSKKHAANSVIPNCQKYGERAIAENWTITKYKRPYKLPQSLISEIFFNRVLQISYLGFEEKPHI
jgi:tetratricopeptide (TPR) repeat protein